MKLPIFLAGAALALTACAGSDGNPIGLPDFGDRATRCDLYAAALDAAEARGVATVTIPALNQTLTVAELRVIVGNVCAPAPTEPVPPPVP